jgi:predicted outer membrane repeat protein
MLGLACACCLLVSVAAGPVAAGSATLVDCGNGGDLQAAIDAASPGLTLTITGTCVGNFIIDKDLTLIGRTPNATLDGGGSGTTLRIPRLEITVAVEDLRITGGRTGLDVGGDWASVTAARAWIGANADDGIVMWPFNTLTLRDSTVEGNGLNGVELNGPISRLFMQSSTVRANGADGISASMQGSAMLDDSAVADNRARGISVGNAGVSLDHSTVSGNAGGGIAANDMAYVLVYSSTIVGNTAETLGGGLLVERGDPFMGGLVVEDTTIVNNTAGISGGGLYITKSDLDTRHANLRNVKFLNNRAGTSGGGIDLVGGGVLDLTDVTFHHNLPDDCLGC